MGGDPQPRPCRPRPSGKLSDPQEQTNPPFSFFSTTRHPWHQHQRGSGDGFVCECFDLFVREETDSEKGRDWHDVTQQIDSESEEKSDPHSWQEAVTWHRTELQRTSLAPGKDVLDWLTASQSPSL